MLSYHSTIAISLSDSIIHHNLVFETIPFQWIWEKIVLHFNYCRIFIIFLRIPIKKYRKYTPKWEFGGGGHPRPLCSSATAGGYRFVPDNEIQVGLYPVSVYFVSTCVQNISGHLLLIKPLVGPPLRRLLFCRERDREKYTNGQPLGLCFDLFSWDKKDILHNYIVSNSTYPPSTITK